MVVLRELALALTLLEAGNAEYTDKAGDAARIDMDVDVDGAAAADDDAACAVYSWLRFGVDAVTMPRRPGRRDNVCRVVLAYVDVAVNDGTEGSGRVEAREVEVEAVVVAVELILGQDSPTCQSDRSNHPNTACSFCLPTAYTPHSRFRPPLGTSRLLGFLGAFWGAACVHSLRDLGSPLSIHWRASQPTNPGPLVCRKYLAGRALGSRWSLAGQPLGSHACQSRPDDWPRCRGQAGVLGESGMERWERGVVKDGGRCR